MAVTAETSAPRAEDLSNEDLSTGDLSTENLATENLATEAWRRIRSISEDPVIVAASLRIMHETGLTGGQLRAMRFLPRTGSLPMRQLARRMGCDNSYVTALIDVLDQRGLAGRELHPSDRRVKVIVLTEEGRRVAEQVQRADTAAPAAFAALTPAEAATLCGLLRKLDPAGDPAGA